MASLGNLDAFFQVATPVLYLTDVIILAALTYLLVRRLVNPQVHYISLFTDYFALFLLLGLASSGVLMRYFTRADIVAVKQLAIGLVTLQPVVPATVGALFFVHLFFLSVLLAYFPFSKLMHMGGVFPQPHPEPGEQQPRRSGTSTPGTIRSRSIPTRSGKTSSTTRSSRPGYRSIRNNR